MKKILTCVATVLLLAGCAKQYDDTPLRDLIAGLDQRLSLVENSVAALQTAVGDGKFVRKVEEYKDPDTGRTTGVTVTYTDGAIVHFNIVPTDPAQGPVFSVIRNGAGELVWAVDGQAVKMDGEDIPVYQTPVFSIDGEGNLVVEVDGQTTILGPVKSEGATLQDGIFTNLAVTDDAVVLTLSDDTTVNIPFAEAFKLNVETTEFTFSEPAPIEIPYTVSGRTEGTVVGTYYDVTRFSVAVEADKIVVTPLSPKSSGMVLVYADSGVGLTSIVSLVVEAEGVETVDTPYSAEVDYLAEGNDATVTANAIANISFDVVPEAEWIHLVSVRSQSYAVTLKLDDNTTGALRVGKVNFVKSGTETVVHTIVIAQKPGSSTTNLAKDGTANCYIVSAAGDYRFPAVKGNSEESVGAVATAAILWETCNNDQAVAPNSVIASVSAADGFITFSTPSTLVPGNALIAAKDAEGTILWSWHIWIPATPVTQGSYGYMTDYEIMSRNVGALVDAAPDASDPQSFGLLYQWGRKDPFVGAKAFGSTEQATIAGTAMTVVEGPMSQEDAAKNPTVFVNVNGEWCTVPDKIYWGDIERDAANTKTIYDPCPPGYRTPARNKGKIFTAAGSSLAGWVYNAETGVASVGSPLSYFPVCGYLSNDGSLVANSAIVWNTRNDWESETSSYCMFISGGDSAKKGRTRAFGGSVRCMTE